VRLRTPHSVRTPVEGVLRMKILESTFLVSDGERGTFVVEFAYSPPMVRVWNRGDYGDALAKPLVEKVNSKREYKPCATHVARLLDLIET